MQDSLLLRKLNRPVAQDKLSKEDLRGVPNLAERDFHSKVSTTTQIMDFELISKNRYRDLETRQAL